MKPTTHQRQIVRTTLLYVEVRASPGSGKTTTLIQRIKHLVRNRTPAHKILVLSFSNNSVDELRSRLQRSFDQKSNSDKKSSSKKKSADSNDLPTIQTVHAFALSVVPRGDGVAVPAPSDSLALLKEALRRCRKDAIDRKLWCKLPVAKRRERLDLVRELPKDSYRLLQLMAAVNFAQAAKQKLSDVMTAPKFAYHLERFAPIALAVQKRFACAKNAAGKLDFGDMLEQAVAAVDDRGTSIPYTHVLVDEFQDGSAAQNLLLVALAKRGCRLMVFGDPEQAIYGFGGNSYTQLDQFIDGAVVMPLPESHRLHRQTAELAMAVAGEHTQKIVTMREGTKPVLVSSGGPSEQARAVVRDIQQLLEQGVDPSSIAVLARTRATLKAVEQSLLAPDINTARKGVERDIRHVQRVLRLVRLVERYVPKQAPIDADAVANVLRKVKQAAKQDWKKRARSLQKAASSSSLEGRYKECRDIYLKVIGGVRQNQKVQHDINSWLAKCRDYASGLEMLRATKQDKPVVQTMTIHAAKGGEWDHVLVVGVADGELPIYKAKSESAIAEERRLLYVAVTRARNAVRLYYAPTQHARSRKAFEVLSSLLQPANVQRTMTQTEG